MAVAQMPFSLPMTRRQRTSLQLGGLQPGLIHSLHKLVGDVLFVVVAVGEAQPAPVGDQRAG